jgi:hypothetical protein
VRVERGCHHDTSITIEIPRTVNSDIIGALFSSSSSASSWATLVVPFLYIIKWTYQENKFQCLLLPKDGNTDEHRLCPIVVSFLFDELGMER